MLSNIFNTTAIAISLSTATGILMHDTRLDKAAATALSPSVMTAGSDGQGRIISIAGDPHTHTERTSLSQAVHEIKTPNPRIQPRGSEDKKHLMQKRVAKGHHPFDSYNLPVV